MPSRLDVPLSGGPGSALDWLDDLVRAKRPARSPVVFTRGEVRAALAQLEGTKWLKASLLYGSGLRLMECVRLRVKDVDCAMSQLIVRDGKGQKDRATVLPTALQEPLKQHLVRVKSLHDQDLEEGFGRVYQPYALSGRIHTRIGCSVGNTSSPHPDARRTRAPGSCAGTTSPRPCSRGPFAGRLTGPD
jgi:integrase